MIGTAEESRNLPAHFSAVEQRQPQVQQDEIRQHGRQ